jgi:transcriptional regulator with XRE-family HTH domain
MARKGMWVVVGREPDAVTELRRALGQRLATFRTAAGLTQGQLAGQVFVDRTTITHLEGGKTGNKGSRDLWKALDGALDAQGALLRGYLEILEAREERERHSREAALTEARAQADHLRVSGPHAWTVQLGLAGHETGEESVSLASIQAMSDAFQMADRKLGSGVLYGQLVRYIRAEIAPALLDPPHRMSTSDLFSAAASFAEVAGWMAHDSGRDEKAQAHFGQAYHLAGVARNPILSANICASLAHLAIQLGQAEDAARIATAGLSNAHGDGAQHLAARLHAMRARAFGLAGNEKRCRTALDTAQGTLDEIGSASSGVGWIAGFDQASLAAEAALCFYALGALAEAEAEARTVIALRTGDRVRSRALGQLTLANILNQSGEPAEAATIGTEICTTTATSLDSARVRTGLTTLSHKLTPHRTIPTVATFLENVATATETRSRSTIDRAPRWPL